MTKVVVIGGGSAGVGAAWRAAKCGSEVVLIESGNILGGTSTLGGVHCWEPGIASTGLNRELYRLMRTVPYGASVGRTIHTYTPESHIVLNGINPDECYESSLRRGTLQWQAVARVHFEPLVLAWAMRKALQDAGVHVVCNMAYLEPEIDSGRVSAVKVMDLITGEKISICADIFIDCTADAVVSRSAGLKTRFGEDAKSDFGEPSAPDKATGIVNGVSLCFRVSPGEVGDEVPRWAHDTPAADWIAQGGLPCSHVDYYPNGDLNFNPLPLMQGAEYFALPLAERVRILTARVYLYWEWMKKEHGHRGWHITQIMPRVGVRESWRVQASVMTTEIDLRKGCFQQGDDTIALGDHVLDTHGEHTDGMTLPREVEIPFGVRAGSLVAEEYENLLIAGRCAGFSHLAASSCRLSRTMMDIGEAAGAMAAHGGDVRECNIAKVRDELDFGRYLEWTEKFYPQIGKEIN